MAESKPIKYTNLLSNEGPNTIDEAIEKLEKLEKQFIATKDVFKKNAKVIEDGLKAVNNTTEEGREQTAKTSKQVDKLAKEYQQLEFALSDTGKELAALREKKRKANQTTRNEIKLANAADS